MVQKVFCGKVHKIFLWWLRRQKKLEGGTMRGGDGIPPPDAPVGVAPNASAIRHWIESQKVFSWKGRLCD